MNYSDLVKNPNPSANAGGYKNVFLFCPRADFTAIQMPTAAGVALGDTLEIASAHTHPANKGFFSWECKTHSVTLKGTTTGEDGAQEMEWSGEFTILGDSASKQEQLMRQLNDDIIVLLKEADCLENDSYVQLGNECVSPVFKVEFDGKTTKEGKKEYKVTITCKIKYFYTAAVTMAA